MKVIILLMLAAVLVIAAYLAKPLPSAWDPFSPLQVTDAPTFITRYKLKKLASDPAACLAVLSSAQQQGYLRFRQLHQVNGTCPLVSPVQVEKVGRVELSARFLASCPLAVSTTMFVVQVAEPMAVKRLASPLARIDHLGSYACRNVYHRASGRLSEHATADALDIAGFRLKNGQKISVLTGWSQTSPQGQWLQEVFRRSCDYYGNALGPEYNRAHASHFHLGMQGFGICR